eukprot:SAG22_NODE_8408_length_659_cov_0.637500_1_plen_170_part_01
MFETVYLAVRPAGLAPTVAVTFRAKGVETLGDLLTVAASKAQLAGLGLEPDTVETLWPLVSSLAGGKRATAASAAAEEEDPFHAMESEILEQKAAAGNADADSAFAAMEAEVLAAKGGGGDGFKDRQTALPPPVEDGGAAAASFHEQAQKLKEAMKHAEDKFGLAPDVPG